jgi:catechol 2,3-dioxygenase-like lactoylglutathione lyase family enzyme
MAGEALKADLEARLTTRGDERVSSFNPIHHVDLNVLNLEVSAAFYDRVLTFIGYRRVDLSSPGEPEGYDWTAPDDSGPVFSIGKHRAQKSRSYDRLALGIHHLALRAKNREEVDKLHHVLKKMDAAILEPPREYPQYESGYYAVFFLDPDGIKLEFVFAPSE